MVRALWMIGILVAGVGFRAGTSRSEVAPPPSEPCIDQRDECNAKPRDQRAEVQEFVTEVFSAGKKPSMATFNRYFGLGDEAELDGLFAICKAKGWLPNDQHPKCLALGTRLADDAAESIFLAWLRSKIGNDPKLEIVQSERISTKGTFLHERIQAKLGDKPVVIVSVLDSAVLAIMGEMQIVDIGGEPVAKLYASEIGSFIVTFLKANEGAFDASSPPPAAPPPQPAKGS